jgi:deoxyribonuclease V
MAGDHGWAAALVVAAGRTVHACVVGVAGAPYRPGLLAAREGLLLDAAVGALPERPDVLVVNATGRDHPRRAGLAVHLGWAHDLPTVGVTDRTLMAVGEAPGPWPGSRSPLWIGDEQVGWWLRTRTDARPVAVSPGWRTDLDSAIEVVESAVAGARTPEPLRQARRLARTSRSRSAGEPPPDH